MKTSGGHGVAAGGAGRFGAITRPQRAMLALLDDGSEDDSVGLEAEELNPYQIAVCERLVGKDLVRFDIGWRYSCWFRLTPAGRNALCRSRARKPTGSSDDASTHPS